MKLKRDTFINTHPDTTELGELMSGTAYGAPSIPPIDASETKRRADVNREFWIRFLAPDGSVYRTREDWRYAASLAASWNTCGCGSINDGLFRLGHRDDDNDWCPMDNELMKLGLEFYTVISNRKLVEAREVFALIQLRGAEVLALQHERGYATSVGLPFMEEFGS